MSNKCRIKILSNKSNGFNLMKDITTKRQYDVLAIKIAKDVKADNHRIQIRIEALSRNEINIFPSDDSLVIVPIEENVSGLTYELRHKENKANG